jgi:hypothetical protein
VVCSPKNLTKSEVDSIFLEPSKEMRLLSGEHLTDLSAFSANPIEFKLCPTKSPSVYQAVESYFMCNKS